MRRSRLSCYAKGVVSAHWDVPVWPIAFIPSTFPPAALEVGTRPRLF
jgi:hypothetical protein